MTKALTAPVTAIVAGLLVVAVTLVQGAWTERWTNRDDGGELSRAAQTLEATFPERFGDWEMQDVIAADPKELERAGAVGAVSRVYRNAKTNLQISAFVVCAAPHDASGHTPDRCYPGAGFQIGEAEHRHEVPLPNGYEAETFTGTFLKGGQTLRIFWTYGVPWRMNKERRQDAADGAAVGDATPVLRWIAPGIARIALNGERAVYKLYVIIDQTALPGHDAMTAGSTFLRDLLATFDERLVETRREVIARGDADAVGHADGSAMTVVTTTPLNDAG